MDLNYSEIVSYSKYTIVLPAFIPITARAVQSNRVYMRHCDVIFTRDVLRRYII